MKWLNDIWLKWIIRTLFESPLGKSFFGWADGKKALIGNILTIISVIIPVIQAQFPALAILPINDYYLLIAGIIVTKLGLDHKVLKGQ